jgi:hypothetical protein
MCTEIRMRSSVLTRRTRAYAIRQGRLQLIKISAPEIEAFIDYQTRDVLTYATPHDARLAVMNLEAFFGDNGGRVNAKSFRASGKIFAAGERQIVGIACVLCAGGRSQATQAAIYVIGAQICESRGTGSALR